MFTTTGLIFADWAGQVVPEHTGRRAAEAAVVRRLTGVSRFSRCPCAPVMGGWNSLAPVNRNRMARVSLVIQDRRVSMDESLRDPPRPLRALPARRLHPRAHTAGAAAAIHPERARHGLPAAAVLPPPGRPAPAGMGAASRRIAAARADAAAKAPKEAPRQYGGSGWPAKQPGGPPVRTLPCLVPVGPGRQQEPRPRTAMRYVRPAPKPSPRSPPCSNPRRRATSSEPTP